MKKTRSNQMLKGLVLGLVFTFGIFAWCSDGMITFAAKTAKVVADTCMIREKADKGSEAVGSAKKGQVLEILDSANDNAGYTWYKVYVDGEKTGYIRGDLISLEEEGATGSNGGGTVTVVGSNNSVTVEKKEETKQENTGVAVATTDVATVKTTTDVRVRKGPGTNYDVVGNAKNGIEAAVSGISADTEGKNWYQISYQEGGKNVDGFIREDFLQILTYVEPPVEEPPVEEPPVVEETPVAVNEDYRLEYTQNDSGNMDWYLYDNIHGTKQSLTQLLNVVEQINENELAASKQVSSMRIIVIVLIVVLVALVVVVTILILKLRDAYEYEYEEDDDDDDEDDDDDDDEDDDEEEERAPRKSRLGFLKKRTVVEEDAEELDDEDEETPEEIQPVNKTENKSWQSKDFLELDDDMEFEFLDL